MKSLKQLVKDTPVYEFLRNWEVKRRWPSELADWERKGQPIPPPHLVKQRVLIEYAQKYNLKILVETGTCFGDMVAAMRDRFEHIYSIELSTYLHEKNVRRFKKDTHITLIQGDSGVELKKVVGKIQQPALFWLDGHYSAGYTAKGDKDTPICEELNYVLNAKVRGHIVIIDDARCFGTDPAYPSLEELTKLVKSIRSDLKLVVKDDCIRITP